MSNSQELHIGKVSKPVFEHSITNDITYNEGLIRKRYDIPQPWTDSGIGAPMVFDYIRPNLTPWFHGFVYALGSTPSFASNSVYYVGTDCETAGDTLGWGIQLSDPHDPQCAWSVVADGDFTVFTMPYGPLPRQYSSTLYELRSIEQFRMTVNSMSNLIYKNAGDTAVHGTATIGLFNHHYAPIYYEVVLKEKFDPYGTITVSGYSDDYNINHPIGGAAVVYYTEWKPPYIKYHAPAPEGDTRFPISMTETPVT